MKDDLAKDLYAPLKAIHGMIVRGELVCSVRDAKLDFAHIADLAKHLALADHAIKRYELAREPATRRE